MNKYLDDGVSDVSEDERGGSGYDSEAAEISKGKFRRVTPGPSGLTKRRKLSHSSKSSGEDDGDVGASIEDGQRVLPRKKRNDYPKTSFQIQAGSGPEPKTSGSGLAPISRDENDSRLSSAVVHDSSTKSRESKTHESNSKKVKRPGVIYLSSLPPYLRPSALKNLLGQRGFEPITRVFLTPASSSSHHGKNRKRKTYAEGWVEFASHSMARKCAETLNANVIGGLKRGWYHDDVWNMRYLRGMAWDELMSGIREERREEEGRRTEERQRVNSEAKQFLADVERSKVLETKRKKREERGQSAAMPADNGPKTTLWRQFDVAGRDGEDAKQPQTDFKAVLGQIF